MCGDRGALSRNLSAPTARRQVGAAPSDGFFPRITHAVRMLSVLAIAFDAPPDVGRFRGRHRPNSARTARRRLPSRAEPQDRRPLAVAALRGAGWSLRPRGATGRWARNGDRRTPAPSATSTSGWRARPDVLEVRGEVYMKATPIFAALNARGRPEAGGKDLRPITAQRRRGLAARTRCGGETARTGRCEFLCLFLGSCRNHWRRRRNGGHRAAWRAGVRHQRTELRRLPETGVGDASLTNPSWNLIGRCLAMNIDG